MAHSLSNTAVITATRSPFISPKPSLLPLSTLTFQPQPSTTTRLPAPPRVVSKTDSSLPSVVNELEKEGSMSVKNDSDLTKRWRKIMGEDNWDCLLDPLDPLLRVELIKYGELAQATGDAFISDTYSKYYGACKFQISDFFDHPFMPRVGYEATQFMYATSYLNWPPFIPKPANPKTWNEKAIWMGLVSVSNDETSRKLGRRDVCVSWRGTVTGVEWGEDFQDFLKTVSDAGIPNPDPHVRVESGFLDLYTQRDENKSSARDQVLGEVKRLINHVYPEEEVSITVTGHSLGAALALLSGYDIMETGTNVRGGGKAVHVSVVAFAGPRVGNISFQERVESLGLKVLRVVNIQDPVPKVPGVVFNESLPDWFLKLMERLNFSWSYTHVGVELALNSEDSPYLQTGEKGSPHNLEGYIHLVDGYQGKGKKFKSATGWDYALVNKGSGFLKEENGVPPEWRVDENKGMVQNKEGRWVHRSTINSSNN